MRGLSIELGAYAYFATYLVFVLVTMTRGRFSPEFLRLHADQSEIPGRAILVVAQASVAVAIGSLFMILNMPQPDRIHMVLGLLSIALGWSCVHTKFGFHYAYEYYETDEQALSAADGTRPHQEGLGFPGSDAPDGLSFLHFSFVVATTAQVSDVQVTSNHMRKLVLLHGILSFFFNAVILAIAVNVVVSFAH